MAYYGEDSSVKIYLQEIGKTALLTPQEEIDLAGLIKQGDEKARERMIKANLRLVVKIAYDYNNFGLPILEGFANNCPVICSDIPVFKEIADQAVEYFDPNDHLSMANTLSKVLFSDLIRKDLIKRGKNRFDRDGL